MNNLSDDDIKMMLQIMYIFSSESPILKDLKIMFADCLNVSTSDIDSLCDKVKTMFDSQLH